MANTSSDAVYSVLLYNFVISSVVNYLKIGSVIWFDITSFRYKQVRYIQWRLYKFNLMNQSYLKYIKLFLSIKLIKLFTADFIMYGTHGKIFAETCRVAGLPGCRQIEKYKQTRDTSYIYIL